MIDIMAYVLTDEQLDKICERSAGLCGNNCMKCEAFAANWRYNNGYDDDDNDDDDDFDWDNED